MKSKLFKLCVSYKCYLTKKQKTTRGVENEVKNIVFYNTPTKYFLKSVSIFTLCITGGFINAQTPISSVTTVYQKGIRELSYNASGAPGSPISANTFTYNFGIFAGTTVNNNELLNFTSNNLVYNFLPIQSQSIKIRRVNNPVVSGVRQLRWSEGVVDTNNIIKDKVDYIENMEELFVGNTHFNTGTDNLFGNQGDGNGDNNNIERLDVMYPNGIVASDYSKVGFALFERGVTTAHDPVKVAVILSLDSLGNPNNYSKIISIVSNNYINATSTDLIPSTDYLIERMDVGVDTHLKLATTTKQAIGGVFFKYSDFGIVANTKIYGYSVIPNDFTGTPLQLIDYNNATHFPTNTSSSTGDGGIDLVSFTGIAQSSPVVNLPISGHVYDDALGLVNGLVNGTGINIDNALYVHLVNSSNVIIATTPVNADGTYSFPPQMPGSYSVVLNTNSSSSSNPNLPVGWINIGEDLQKTVSSGGIVDGVISNISLMNKEVYDVNFGIDLPPNSVNLSATLTNVANGTLATLDGLGANPPALQGSDAEDQPNTGSLINKTVVITELPTNSALYYNNVLVVANQSIPNFNPSLLQDKITTTNAADSVIVFKYAFVDAAGVVDATPATYTIHLVSTNSILPVNYCNFYGKEYQNIAKLKWDISPELNVDKFEIEQSLNGVDWKIVNTIPVEKSRISANGFSYSLNLAKGVNYFRIVINERGGTKNYSHIISLQSNVDIPTLFVYPTIASTTININIPNNYENGTINIVDMLGSKVQTLLVKNNLQQIVDISKLARGKYLIALTNNSNKVLATFIKQ